MDFLQCEIMYKRTNLTYIALWTKSEDILQVSPDHGIAKVTKNKCFSFRKLDVRMQYDYQYHDNYQ